MKRILMMIAVSAAALTTGGFAQEGSADPEELMRQIKRNLQKIEDELNRMKSSPASTDAAAREKDMETLKRRQDQVVQDIDDIIKQMKNSSCDNPSESSAEPPPNSKPKNSQSGQKPKSRDRNKSEQGQKPKDGKQPQSGDKPKGGQKPKDGETGKKPSDGSKKDGEGKPQDPNGKTEDNAQKNSGNPENRKGPLPLQDPRRRIQQVDVNEVWGILPPEIRQKLVDRNFGEFTPEYEDEVRDYLKKVSTGR